MLLATGSAFDFVKFIQILFWIILPVFFLAVLLTVFFHYRKKKIENAEAENRDEEFMKASPECLGYTKGDGEYVFFDHSSLISEYKNRLSFNHARYTALRHDFKKLEMKYANLASYTTAISINNKTTGMENTYDDMPKQMQEEIAKLSADYKAEKDEWLTRLEQMNQSYQNLEGENQLLRDQVNMQTASEEEKAVILNRWKEENSSLKEKVAEQQYLKDILEEKKAQMNFLQNQLEQRIRNQHLAEQQGLQIMTELKETKGIYTNDLQELKNELLQKQEEADKVQIVLCGKEEQLEERQQLLASRIDHITWLENILRESKEQNEILNASVADSGDLISALQEQLSHEQLRNLAIEQKLSSNKQLLQQLYKGFSAIMAEENGQSPVIALRPEYVNRENEEIAAQ